MKEWYISIYTNGHVSVYIYWYTPSAKVNPSQRQS